MSEEWNEGALQHLLVYIYDASGVPIDMAYRDSTYSRGAFDFYLFAKNVRGDMVAGLGPKPKSLIDLCTANVLNDYMLRGFTGNVPTLKDFNAMLKAQPEPESKDIALSLKLFTSGSLDTFANETNVDTENRLICYDIYDLGKHLMPIGMFVVLDNILNRIMVNKAKGRKTYIFIDEIYLLYKHEYSATSSLLFESVSASTELS